MEATSSSAFSINGRIIKFKTRKCNCGIKAAMKISESPNNPNKLYFFCERGKCKFYRFWEPDNEEFNQAEYIESISERFGSGDNFQRLEQEMTVLNARLMKLEMVWERVQHLESLHARMHNLETNIHGRMHHLESKEGSSRLTWAVNMALFCVTMAIIAVKMKAVLFQSVKMKAVLFQYFVLLLWPGCKQTLHTTVPDLPPLGGSSGSLFLCVLGLPGWTVRGGGIKCSV
ncbi:hypothetical protein EZV62_024238 [Acer yangbiense]|uniref:Zinc finger GRF-type domain-containing protein n=1 Tax=Acer yangbiense TaxID=1000413 RepID=A0A5C7H3Z2_9ROSI|nr:hypothetical protein EZV62_024238 [Acer yangbiense]